VSLSEIEARYGILERDKAVLEQSQTQLLADYKAAYERSAHQEEMITALQDASGAAAGQLQQQRESNAALSLQNSELQAQVSTLSSQLTALRESPSELGPGWESLQQEVAHLTAANQQLIDQLADLTHRLAARESELSEMTAVSSRKTLETAENSRRAIELLEEEVARLKEENVLLVAKKEREDRGTNDASLAPPAALSALFETSR
jgi:chromosome segregation ATPase